MIKKSYVGMEEFKNQPFLTVSIDSLVFLLLLSLYRTSEKIKHLLKMYKKIKNILLLKL